MMRRKYKGILSFFLAIFCVLGLVSCNNIPGGNPSTDGGSGSGNGSTSDNGGGENGGSETNIDDVKYVLFHYRDDNLDATAEAYAPYDVWTWDWAEGQEGQARDWDGTDDFGAYITVEIDKYKRRDHIGIIVRTAGAWGGFQTSDIFINAAEFNMINENTVEVYSLLNMDATLTFYKEKASASGDRVKAADFTSFKDIHVIATAPVTSYTVYKDEEAIYSGGAEEAEFDIELTGDVELDAIYSVQASFASTDRISSRNVYCNKLYNTAEFKNKYTYTGTEPLGVTFKDGKTTFRVWTPVSKEVLLNIYSVGTPASLDPIKGSNAYSPFNMIKKDQGIFEYTMNSDMTGFYYTYTVTNYAGTVEVVDPYAVSTGINGLRGYICNMDSDKAKPEGWDDVTFCDIKDPTELTVYELHVDDLTADDTWTGTETNRGKYLGLVESGTSYTNENNVTVTTGFDHIDELGVNAVQLLPIFDQSNDERPEEYSPNWGYNPLNYNSPEGAYSSNPYNGLAKILELRSVIAGLSKTKAKTRTIMDVVYNHVANASASNFNYLVPGYYFRYNADGSLSNGSGCGNEVNTEAPMVRKFIVDSIKHWATNYKIKGFRFDLMALIDCQTMKEVAEALYEIDPSIVCYGEPWAMLNWNEAVANRWAVTPNVYKYLYPYKAGNTTTDASWDTKSRIAVGAFNDENRDSMGGSHSGGVPGYGLISQGINDYDQGKANEVIDMIKGAHTNNGHNPHQEVSYLSCHDNFTLFDKLNWTLSSDGGYTEPDLDMVAQACVSAYTSIFFSQGIAFMQSGDEFMRTKIELPEADGTYLGSEEAMMKQYGKLISHNSYMSPSSTNSLKWDRKAELIEWSNQIADAIHLRSELQDSILSYSTLGSVSANMSSWGDPVVTGYGVSYNYGNETYHMLSQGRLNKDFGSVGIGNGTYEVVYCSSGRLSAGDRISVSNYLITVAKFETIVIKAI